MKKKHVEIVSIYATLKTYKNVTAQSIFFLAKTHFFFQDGTAKVKIKLQTTISNSF